MSSRPVVILPDMLVMPEHRINSFGLIDSTTFHYYSDFKATLNHGIFDLAKVVPPKDGHVDQVKIDELIQTAYRNITDVLDKRGSELVEKQAKSKAAGEVHKRKNQEATEKQRLYNEKMAKAFADAISRPEEKKKQTPVDSGCPCGRNCAADVHMVSMTRDGGVSKCSCGEADCFLNKAATKEKPKEEEPKPVKGTASNIFCHRTTTTNGIYGC